MGIVKYYYYLHMYSITMKNNIISTRQTKILCVCVYRMLLLRWQEITFIQEQVIPVRYMCFCSLADQQETYDT